MSIKRVQQDITKKITNNSGEWVEKVPGTLGDQSGVVYTTTPGKVNVQMSNGQVVQVYSNAAVPNTPGLNVFVGRNRITPAVWQVISVRQNFLTPATMSTVGDHHAQHEFPNQDTVWVNRRQILSLLTLVSDAALFKVQIYGGLVRTKHGIVMIDNQELDLSSYVPVSGSIYVAIESDEDGALSVHEGTPFGLPEDATYSDVPTPDAGYYTIAFVLLHYLMTSLSNDVIGIPVPLVVDYIGIETGAQIHDATADTPLNADEFGFWDVVDAALKKITWANIKAILDTLYAAIGHTHTSTTRWEPLANGDPAGPALVFTPDGDVIMVEITL